MVKYLRTSLKEAILYSCLYLIIFLFAIKHFSDGGYTSLMFAMISFVTACLVIFYNSLLNTCFYFLGYAPNVLIKALVFFILSELAVLTITWELPFFGLIKLYAMQHSGYTFSQNSSYTFQHARDFALSMSGFIASVLFFAARKIYLSKKSEIANS